MVNVGDYVNIIQDNAPDERYNGKKGTVSEIQKQENPDYNSEDPESTEFLAPLYVVEVDINSGDEGTCIAKEVQVTTEHPI